jgi:hypothetical protein
MRKGDYEAELIEPTELNPGEEATLKVRYENRSEESNHYLRRLLIRPTWGEQVQRSECIETTIPQGEARSIDQSMDTPPSIGGRQGGEIGVEVSFDNISSDTQAVWTDRVERIPVNAPTYHALICVHSNETGYSPITSLLRDWGFELSVVQSQEDLHNRIESDGTYPDCVFALILDSEPAENKSLATAAVSEVRNIDKKVPVIIIKDRTIDEAGIPPDDNNRDLARHIEIESGDTQKLESRHGDRLMSIRNSIETERQEILIDLSIDPKDLPEKLSRGFIDALFWMIVFDRLGLDERTERTLDQIGVPEFEPNESAPESGTTEVDDQQQSKASHASDDTRIPQPSRNEDTTVIVQKLKALELIAHVDPGAILDTGAGEKIVSLLDHEKKEVGTSAADAHSALVSNHSKNIVADIGLSQYPEEWELLRQATAAQGFIEALDHANEEIRLAAAHAIGRWLEDADAVTRTQASDCLANLLTDEYQRVRRKAAFALGEVAKEFPKAVVQAGAVGDLTDLLTDEHETVREWAAFALGEIAMHFPKVVIRAGGHHELSQGLRDSSTNVRTQADVALNKLGKTHPDEVWQARANATGGVFYRILSWVWG